MSLLEKYFALLQDTKLYLQENSSSFFPVPSHEMEFYKEDINSIVKKQLPVSPKTSFSPNPIKPPIVKETIPSKQPIETPKSTFQIEPAPLFQKPPPTKKELHKTNPNTPSALVLEPPLPITTSLSETKQIIEKIAPNLNILTNIPSDSKAKEIAEKWKYKNKASPITILVHHQNPQSLAFLKNLSKATENYFYPTRLVSAKSIEEKNAWETFLSSSELKLIILCDDCLQNLPNLRNLYKEIPASSEIFLQNTSLFMLPPLSLYIKDSLLKISLWNALSQKIQSIKKV